MNPAIPDLLTRIGIGAFYWSLGLFVLINGVAALLFISKQNRALVNRWTGRVLAIDLLLVGTGVGVPLVAGVTRLTMSAVSTMVGSSASAAPLMSANASELTPTRR